MHKRIPVAEITIDEESAAITRIGSVFAPERLPLSVAFKKNRADRAALNEWWQGRSIPASRSGLREALELLHVSYAQRMLTKCYGLSLSDQYWICPEGSGLTWDAVNFFENPFSEDVGNALFGKEPGGKPDLLSPDSTSDGWLRKKWVVIDGKRCLIKGGSNPFQQEPLSEVLASIICARLGIPHVTYTLVHEGGLPYSVCEDFITSQTELISAAQIMQSRKQADGISKYKHFLNCCDALGIPDAADYLDKMLTLDFLIVNEDRHFNNFGMVREAETLEWLNFAPIFDSGTSLWHDHAFFGHSGNQTPSKPFCASHTEQIELVTDFGWLDLDALEGIEDEFERLLTGNPFISSERRGFLRIALRRRVEMLSEHI